MSRLILIVTATLFSAILFACGQEDTETKQNQQAAQDPSKSQPATTEQPEANTSCNDALQGSIEFVICDNAAIAELDNTINEVYQQALSKTDSSGESSLRATQRGWIKGRDECWKSKDQVQCVEDAYQQRIAELQAWYQLVDSRGPFQFICENDPANEFIVTFFQTDPATLIAERGDQSSLMYSVPSGSGTKYRGRNEVFWEHQGEAKIQWGYQAPELTCRKPEA